MDIKKRDEIFNWLRKDGYSIRKDKGGGAYNAELTFNDLAKTMHEYSESQKQLEPSSSHIGDIVNSALSDEEALSVLANCPFEKSGWCYTTLKCRFKLECGEKEGNGCELSL